MLRHSHNHAYAALVLRGGYVEAGNCGRHCVGPGEVLLHGCFDAHQDEFGPGGADILNLPCAAHTQTATGRVHDADAIVRLAEYDSHAAGIALAAALLPANNSLHDWPDLLAAALRRNEVTSLARWAEAHGMSPASLSQGFAKAYGVAPKRFRLEQRAARAAKAILAGERPTATLALELGFADQAHMSRAVRRLTGASPRALQRCA